MADTAGPVARSNWLLWPTPQALFSLTSRKTLDMLCDTTIPEIRKCAPTATIVVVGNFLGFRDENNKSHVLTEEGVRRSKDAGAFAYCECCGTTGQLNPFPPRSHTRNFFYHV